MVVFHICQVSRIGWETPALLTYLEYLECLLMDIHLGEQLNVRLLIFDLIFY